MIMQTEGNGIDNEGGEQPEAQTRQARTLETPAYKTSPAPRSSGYAGGSYPGAGPAVASTSYSARNLDDGHDSDRTLTIGSGITMSGEIESCDNLVVEGTVEAALRGAKMLDIYETGTFYGTVEIEEATVAGRFEGELVVNGRLTIRKTGSIAGSISYRELEVESGAVLDGKLTPLKARPEVQQREVPKIEKPKGRESGTAGTKAAKVQQQEAQPQQPANSDGGSGGLFSGGTTATAAAE